MNITLNEILIKLEHHLKNEHLKSSSQREDILRILYNSGKHLTAEELYDICKKSIPNLGIATIYRAIKLFCSIGVCTEIIIDNGITRYEINDNHHHDHLICSKCGIFVGIVSPEIEKIQKKISENYGFELVNHRLNLYGICPKCRAK
ncbi:MAG TPA: Fur family transcriptional regulator [Spirochaetota bacterium]|nr:Fur family transcriptional regulator [Spirochaetota bacterium]HPS87512.1 Fur family transcriptional regulator [Spirochaetota bacterium]